MQAIETLKKGTFFRKKENSKKTYIANGYCRFNRKYEGGNFDDISDFTYIKKGTMVYVDFEF